MSAVLQSITVKITVPFLGDWIVKTLNVTNKAAREAGEASPIDSIRTSWSLTGPLGQAEPAESRLTIVSSDPTPYEMGAWVNVAATFPSATPSQLIYGWVDTDTVTPLNTKPIATYAHELVIIDPLQVAADRPCGIVRPSESTTARWAALAAAHPDLLPAPTASGNFGTTNVPPLAADVSVLTAVQVIAQAEGRRVVSMPPDNPVYPLDLPSGSGSTPWWRTVPNLNGRLVTLTTADAEQVPATMNRSSRITDVTLSYRASDGTTINSELFQDSPAGSRFPSRLTLDTHVVTSAPASSASLIWHRLLARAITACATKPQPTLAQMAVAPPTSTAFDQLATVPTRNLGTIIELNPCPDGATAINVAVGGSLTIWPDLTYELMVATVPAGVYGLRPITHNELTAADTYTATAPMPRYTLFSDLRATWPRSIT